MINRTNFIHPGKSPAFGATVILETLVPHSRDREKIKAGGTDLLYKYRKYGDDDVIVRIFGGYYTVGNNKDRRTPATVALIKVKEPATNEYLDARVDRIIYETGDEAVGIVSSRKEPIKKYLKRINRELNKLIKIAELQPEKKPGRISKFFSKLIGKK